jgi:hypothetical protein
MPAILDTQHIYASKTEIFAPLFCLNVANVETPGPSCT